MRYKIVIIIFSSMGLGTFLYNNLFSNQNAPSGSIYDFKIAALDGELIDFSRYKGKKLLIVNTASKCGYTYQYEGLEKLHEQFGDKVNVLGFPANNFLWQEPGENSEIANFCQKNYGVSFQMFEKISVRGKDQHPLYSWLAARSGETPNWNFCKYVVDENGNVVGFFGKKVEPMDSQILKQLGL